MKQLFVFPAIASLTFALSIPAVAAPPEPTKAEASSGSPAVASHASSGGGAPAAVERSSGAGSAAAVRTASSEPHFSHASSNPATSSFNNRAAQNHGGNAPVAARFANGTVPKPSADFNRGNHYGGRWSEAKEHAGWSHDGIHLWDHHHYRWYDGGWLILDDDGADDSAYTEVESADIGPVSFNAIARRAQAELAREGYYSGAMDGRITPEFRQAIEKYQRDHGLHVTGLVDARVIQSLQVE